jgi:hypothetical protein
MRKIDINVKLQRYNKANGIHMTTDTKLRQHNATSKASLCYGSEDWIINKRDAQKLEAAQMRLLRPLLGLKRLDRQRHPDIRNIKSGQLSRIYKIVPKEMIRPPGTNG